MVNILLTSQQFSNIIRDTPLISIDLIIEDETGSFLLGFRKNPPANQSWFVPGGRIRKDETLDKAFLRLCIDEIGLKNQDRNSAEFLGVYEHFYADNALQEPGFGTHYVVLAYRLRVIRCTLQLLTIQHYDYQWLLPSEIMLEQYVHRYSKAYFINL